MKKLYPIYLFFALLLLSNAAFGQTKLLFVGSSTDDGDTLLRYNLINEGYVIGDIVEDGVFLTDYAAPEAYADYDAVFISEIIGSGNANAFRDAGYPIPCVSTEIWVTRTGNWGWIEDNDQVNGDEFHQLQVPAEEDDDIKTLIIDNDEHYITKWYGLEAEVDWTTDETITDVLVNGATLDQTMSDAIQLAHFKNAAMEDFPSMWAIEAGSSVNATSVMINSRIVLLGIHQAGLTGGFATDDYYNLIKRSLEWVTDNESSVEDFTGKQEYDLSIMPNPTSGIVNLSFTLNTSGNVQIDIYDITGKMIESLESGYLDAGPNTLTLDFTDKPNAQYIVSLITDNNVLTRKILKTQ